LLFVVFVVCCYLLLLLLLLSVVLGTESSTLTLIHPFMVAVVFVVAIVKKYCKKNRYKILSTYPIRQFNIFNHHSDIWYQSILIYYLQFRDITILYTWKNVCQKHSVLLKHYNFTRYIL
jgi:hypothetical protein